MAYGIFGKKKNLLCVGNTLMGGHRITILRKISEKFRNLFAHRKIGQIGKQISNLKMPHQNSFCTATASHFIFHRTPRVNLPLVLIVQYEFLNPVAGKQLSIYPCACMATSISRSALSCSGLSFSCASNSFNSSGRSSTSLWACQK